jgi:DNA segregation ATPase FtsK/SpoIIIE-like protein
MSNSYDKNLDVDQKEILNHLLMMKPDAVFASLWSAIVQDLPTLASSPYCDVLRDAVRNVVYQQSLEAKQAFAARLPQTIDQSDRLFAEAVNVIAEHDRASASLLQRRLRIGYARAARIIDELEARGFVGPFDGSTARVVLGKAKPIRASAAD